MAKGDVPAQPAGPTNQPPDTGRFWIVLWLVLLAATAVIVFVAIEML